MSFADPVLLAVGLLVAVALAWAAIVVARRRAAALTAAGVAPSGRGGRRDPGRTAGVWCTIAGVAVLAIAVAGPAASVPVSHASGTVILAMDVSGSMAATDVPPDRLDAAKQAAVSFINAQPPTVDIGVVAFQQGGLEAALPTADHATATSAVRRLAPGGGTSLGDAILASLSAITHRTVGLGRNGIVPAIGYWPSATIVLFSDGQDEGSWRRDRHDRRRGRRRRPAGRRAHQHRRGRHRRGHDRRRGWLPPVHRARRGHAHIVSSHRRCLPPGFGREPAQRDRLVDQPQGSPSPTSRCRWPARSSRWRSRCSSRAPCSP